MSLYDILLNSISLISSNDADFNVSVFPGIAMNRK